MFSLLQGQRRQHQFKLSISGKTGSISISFQSWQGYKISAWYPHRLIATHEGTEVDLSVTFLILQALRFEMRTSVFTEVIVGKDDLPETNSACKNNLTKGLDDIKLISQHFKIAFEYDKHSLSFMGQRKLEGRVLTRDEPVAVRWNKSDVMWQWNDNKCLGKTSNENMATVQVDTHN